MRKSKTIEIPPSALATLERFQAAMSATFGLELSEGQVVEILIHMAADKIGKLAPEPPALLPGHVPWTPATSAAEPKKRRGRKPKAEPRTIKCGCGCGGTLTTPDPRGQERRFLMKRSDRLKAEAEAAGKKEKVVWSGGPLIAKECR